MAGDAVQPRIGGTLPRPAQPPETRLTPGSVGPVPPFVGVRSGDYAVGGEVGDRFWVVGQEIADSGHSVMLMVLSGSISEMDVRRDSIA